ncbi:hypothetical protein SH1V18_21320 [Vallitalea longa]|uniref:GLUG domain-containing protein n=1 Tax=Vallitalea longa TaxID=2936439 RepID=A0A9W5YA13_9FIRM|nr:GLUG motif-containing protein [Vallitalea longa]GKX29652.1 hypothetical protein SH1V18_21320 [Vallitalea longa]
MKKLNFCLSIVLTFSIILSLTTDSMAETTSNIIYIKTAEDLVQLSKNCTLDTYSKNKIVKLTADIDLSNTDFKMIPSFSGIFDGDNHKISGFDNNTYGTNQGLFRYLEEDGVIKNLSVEGNIKPLGSKKEIGGIVGTNKGHIFNCSFSGDITGTTSIGGIVGYNNKSGIVQNCISYGNIIGEHYTGGIVGQNIGYITECTNESEVNTTDDSIPNNDMASYSIQNINLSKLNSTENVNAQTDTGGIVGYNQGIVESSENHGEVGYHHVGYNIGGIAGRQSGYINNCKNYATVKGRKDVSGIAGQAEPYIRLLFSEDTLEDIDDELVTLNNMVQDLIDNGDQSTETVKNRLDSLNSLTSSACDQMQDLLNNTTDYIDDSTSTVNTGIDRINHAVDQMEPVIDYFKNASDQLTNGFDEIGNGFDELAESSVSIRKSIHDIDDAFEDLNDAAECANSAFDNIARSMKLLERAAKNSPQFDKAIDELDSGLDDLHTAVNAGIEALNQIASLLENLNPPLNPDWIEFIDGLREQLEIMSEHLDSGIPKIKHALKIYQREFKRDQTLVRESLVWTKAAMEDFRDFCDYLYYGSKDLDYALDDVNNAVDSVNSGMQNFSNGMDYFSKATDQCTDGIDNIKSIIEEYNDYEKLQIPELKDYATESSDLLFEEIDKISNDLTLLNSEVKNESETFFDNLRKINSQIEVIADIIRDTLDTLSFDDTDIFEDVSDLTIIENSLEKGIVKGCYNEADILGDVNVGGIAGSMAIEYDFDPEDDIVDKGKQSFNFKYQTKALLMSSINKGNVQAKKDYVGGIIGRMDLGLVYSSENYGYIENIDGDYTGGITGSSDSVIRNCYSLSELTGRDYVGGITGYGTDIFNCFSLVKIDESKEFSGAIAGKIEGNFDKNYFVESELAGVDGISYGNKAMPQSYENFILNKRLPETFKSFELIFKADDEIIEVIPFEYGDSIELDKIPDIPAKKGYYATWPDYDYSGLEFSRTFDAIYTPMIQVLSSDSTNPQPKLLVEGEFNEDDNLKVEEINCTNKKINNRPQIEQWRVMLNTTENKASAYRLLKPDTKNKILLYEKTNDKWKKLKTTVDGSYVLFETDSKNFELAVVEKEADKTLYICLGILLVFILFMIMKKKRKARKAKKASKAKKTSKTKKAPKKKKTHKKK